MADIRPFRAFRPAADLAAEVAALPYDVYSREEARDYVRQHPSSFLSIDRAETNLPPETDIYDASVYAKARELLDQKIAEGIFLQDETPCYYLYEQTWQGRTQTGIVACASIDEYRNGIIKKHENTVEAKEQDRICHVDACSAQTGPIFLTYREDPELAERKAAIKHAAPVCDFVSDGGVQNRVFVIDNAADIQAIQRAFQGVSGIYIADGHHRAASAVKVGLKRRAEHPGYTGQEEFNYFLSVLFPEEELQILDYNRVVLDRNGKSRAEILEQLRPNFNVIPCRKKVPQPAAKGEIGMYLEHDWFLLCAKNNVKSGDPVAGLDVSILQRHVLRPIFGIVNPRTDSRIAFVGGIRGTEELMKRADAADGVSFLMHPTSIRELLAVADAGKLMPPKSTWFEPKLLSGLFLHQIEE